jgi:hypothetical protein
MKLFKVFVVLLVLSLSSVGYAFEPEEWMENTTTQTADAATLTGTGYLYGFVFDTDGTNDVTFDIYDNTSGSGTKLVPTTIEVTTSSTNRISTLSFEPPLAFNTGVYVDLTTAGAVGYMVYYRMR